jgi:4'-phosphopantetheinyl transferase
MQLFWIEQRQSCLPTDMAWLSSAELSRVSVLHVPKRRADWVLGRWTAKSAVISYLGLSSRLRDFAAVEIRASTSGAPEVFWHGNAIPVSVSLTHRQGIAACAIGPGDASFGCDLELVEDRDPVFVADYFSAEEQHFVQRVPAPYQCRTVTLIWSAKESALKALRTGLRLDTRSVAVRLDDHLIGCSVDREDSSEWNSFALCGPDSQTFFGWSQCNTGFVKTLVSTVPVSCPTSLAPLTFDEPAARRLTAQTWHSDQPPINLSDIRKEA